MPSTALYSVNPSSPLVRDALAYNHLTTVPPEWAMSASGQLVNRRTGTLIATGTPGRGEMPFWKQTLHALPYLAAGIAGPAAAGALAGGAGGAAAAGGFSTGLGATGAESTAGLLGGYGTVAGVGGATGAGLGGAATGGAFDAAGNFIGPSTYGSTAGGSAAAGGGGIWGNLAKGTAAAKTGSSIWDNVAGLGQDAGALALGRADARQQEALAQQRQDQLALERYQAGLQGTTADLAQRRFALEAPGQRASNAVRGDVLANAQDVSFSGLPPRLQGMIPTISGGLRPSMFSPATRQLGGLLSSQALEGQQKGDTFAPLPTLPSATPLPSGNALDTGLTLGGTAASLAPSFWDLLSRYRKRQATPDYLPGGSTDTGSTDTPGWDTGYG